jgi:hypothetical protein
MPERLPTRRTARKSAAVPATIESEPPARRRAAWGVQSFSERRKRVVRSAAEIAAARQGGEKRSSAYVGVSWAGGDVNKWNAKIAHCKQQHQVGNFNDELEAAKAYDVVARRLHGQKARLNFPRPGERQGVGRSMRTTEQRAAIEAQHNKRPRPHQSEYCGVGWSAKHLKWRAQIQYSKKDDGGKQTKHHQFLGLFADEHDAARAYNAVAVRVRGKGTVLNQVPDAVAQTPDSGSNQDGREELERPQQAGLVGIKREPGSTSEQVAAAAGCSDGSWEILAASSDAVNAAEPQPAGASGSEALPSSTFSSAAVERAMRRNTWQTGQTDEPALDLPDPCHHLPIYTNASRVAAGGFGAFASRPLASHEFVGECELVCTGPSRTLCWSYFHHSCLNLTVGRHLLFVSRLQTPGRSAALTRMSCRTPARNTCLIWATVLWSTHKRWATGPAE